MSKQIGFDWRRVLGFASAGATIAIGGAAADARAGGTDGWEGRYVACWGNNGEGQCNVPAELVNVTAVAAGYMHNAVIKDSGAVACWGLNDHQQCVVPVDVTNATAVAVGAFHTAAIRSDRTVKCWGWSNSGQCTTPEGLSDVSSIAAGEWHTIAIKADGSISCWGLNTSGQCDVPQGLGLASSAAGGNRHTVALLRDGTVFCWGGNDNNQCSVPAPLRGVIAVAAGYAHTVALRGDGTVGCWGLNNHGQCVVPPGLSNVTAIAAGYLHTVVLTGDGRVRCWGNNGNGACNVPSYLPAATSVAAGLHTVALTASVTYPVRASSPEFTSSAYFPSIAAALVTPSNWLIESTSISQPGFSAANRSIRGVADLNVTNYVSLDSSMMSAAGDCTISGGADLRYGSTLSANGKLTISGYCSTFNNIYAGPQSSFRSNLVTTTDVAIELGTIASTGILAIAPSATRVLGPIDLTTGGNMWPDADITTSHRLILDGGVLSSDPSGTNTNSEPQQRLVRFDTCTDPAYSAVTPCLEFGPLSVIDLPPGNKIISHGPTTTLVGGLATLRNGSSIETDADLAISGSMRVPVGTAISLSVDRVHIADPALSIRDGGELVVEFGSSVQVAAPAKTSIAGSLTVDQSALFSLLGGADTLRVDPRGDARCFGGTIRADQMILAGAPVGSPSTVRGGRLVGVNALVDVDSVRVQGGSVNLATSSLIGDLVTEAQVGGSATVSTIAASGQIFGNVDNGNGKLISIGNLVVVGDVNNGVGSQILAQVGIIYITGNLINNGAIFGNVITAPSFNGGGTGGTQIGDGIRVVGTVDVGAQGELRFVEDLWKFSVCGDVSLACASDSVRFDGAKLSLDGCNGTVQSLEATSADLGCVASAFSGAETEVSLIGELDIATGATVSLVDNFNNAPGKAAEVVYARGLTVKPGATLLTNGIKIVTRNALIQGTVDDIANICVVIDTPDPDMNGDGHVNGIDLAFILAYWGTSTPIADLNDDGIVGGFDLALVLNGWTGNN